MDFCMCAVLQEAKTQPSKDLNYINYISKAENKARYYKGKSSNFKDFEDK